MGQNIHLDIDSLNSSLRNFLARLSNKEEHSTSLSQWLSLYRLARSNRVESCFSQLDLNNQDEYHLLYLKMIRKRTDILFVRENRMRENYGNLNQIFQARNLSPICFKGFGLSLENSIPYRVKLYEDIDLVVGSPQASDYLEILFSSGYKTKFNSLKIDPLLILNSAGSLNLSNHELGHNIDLHITPIWPYFSQVLNYEDLLKDAKQIRLANKSHLLLPSLAHHALILLLEGTKDIWFRIDKLLDFYFCFMNLEEIELEDFNRLLSKHKLNKMLDLAKYLLAYILEFEGVDLPMSTVDLSLFESMINQISKEWGYGFNRNAPTEPFRTKAHLCIMESSHAKLSYIVRRASLPTENDLRIFSFFTKMPYMFFMFRPARKLFIVAKKFVVTSNWRLLWH